MSQNRNFLGVFDDLLMNFTRLATQLFRDMLVKLGKILMKKTMITSTLMTLFTSLLVTPSFAADSFDYSQHNFTVKSGNMSLKYRDHSRLDKWMTQFDVKIAGYGYAYRYQQSKGNVEHRFRLSLPKALDYKGFSIAPRFEYRAFNKESKDDFANVWLRVQYQKKFGAFKAYAKIQPKFAIDRDGYDDGEYYEAQNNYGVDYKVSDKLSVGVYLEQNTDDDWNVKSEFIATKVSYKF